MPKRRTRKPTEKTWQYKLTSCHVDSLSATLREFGKKRWELVGYHVLPDAPACDLVFKRPVRTPIST